MAIDFPVPSQLGEQYTDPTTGITYTCAQVGPPTVWTCGHAPPSSDDTYVTVATTQEITGVKTFSGDPLTITGEIVCGEINADGDLTLDGGAITTDNLTIFENGGVVPTLKTITEGEFSLKRGIAWTCGAINIPNPDHANPGQSGLILLTAAPTSWGSAFKFPGGVGNAQPETASYPAMVAYFCQDSNNMLMGTPIAY